MDNNVKTVAFLLSIGILSASLSLIGYDIGRQVRQLASEKNAITSKPYSELETTLFKQARKSVFKVIASENGDLKWTGTAFLAQIAGTQVIVTAGHVCKGETEYALDQEDDLFATSLVAVSAKTDICFLSVSRRLAGIRPYVIKTNGIPYGQVLAAIGHAGGGRLTQYLIRSVGKETIQIDGIKRTFYKAVGAVYPGQSGGPVVDNIDGTAVALISATDGINGYVTSGAEIAAEFDRLVIKKKKSTDVQL